jgi:hypothetical protein
VGVQTRPEGASWRVSSKNNHLDPKDAKKIERGRAIDLFDLGILGGKPLDLDGYSS